MKTIELPISWSILALVIRRILIPLVLLACLAVAALWVILGRQPSPESWALMLRSPDPEKARHAQAALRNSGTNAIPNLLQMLTETDTALDTATRRAVLNTPPTLRKHIPRGIPPESAEWRNLCAAQALAVLGTNATVAVPILADVMERAGPPLRLESAIALSSIGIPSLPRLAQSLTNPSPDVRVAAAFALGRMGGSASAFAPELADLLDDKDVNVREKAAWSLSMIGPSSRAALKRKLDNGSPEGRVAAASVYVKVAESTADALQHAGILLADFDETVRLGGLDVIKNLPGRGLAAIRMFTNSLTDPSPEVRSLAAEALAGSAPPYHSTIMPPLTMLAAGDDSAYVRKAASNSLQSLKSP